MELNGFSKMEVDI